MKGLLTRDEFRNQVFERDNEKCVICEAEGKDAHHIIERKLWDDGGYYLSNGATLCSICHLLAEQSAISCDSVRKAAGIELVCLPESLDPKNTYDKWGNEMQNTIVKYPRTKHIETSGLQKGDDLEIVKFVDLQGKPLVIEEKVDGCSVAVSFDSDANLLLQSRGHYLTGGDWPEFDEFKVWGNTWADALFDILEDRFIMYGEWMGAFHSVYYDILPHYFMEFDVYDKQEKIFLDTPRRHDFLKNDTVAISHVKVLETNKFNALEDILDLVSTSHFISIHAHNELNKKLLDKKFPDGQIENLLRLNRCRLMEGLYIKWEEDGIVKDRYKYVRQDFIQTILEDGEHWSKRPTVKNELVNSQAMYEAPS